MIWAEYLQDRRVFEELGTALGCPVESQKLATVGHNWGNAVIDGSTLVFMVDGKPAFRIPLPDVTQVPTPTPVLQSVILWGMLWQDLQKQVRYSMTLWGLIFQNLQVPLSCACMAACSVTGGRTLS